MKVSLNWLNDFIDLEESPETIAERLTMLGLEVEGIQRIEAIPGGLEGVVIGKVLECRDHPNADRLVLTTVDIGEEYPRSIVCGAPNVAKGQKVLVATVGTTLHPQGGDSFEIKEAEIRGEQSQGMICAEDELGLGDSHEGIVVLPEEAEVGTPAADYYELETDVVIDIDLTPNRSDATHHLGVARDLAAWYNARETQSMDIRWPESESDWGTEEKDEFKVDVLDVEGCPRYGGVLLDQIEIRPSPQWMQNRLKAIGLRPKNNVVDITNYVLHELGQPLHAFDSDEVRGNGIIVRTLEQGTSFTTLDGEERSLSDEDLMICDAEHRPLCIAGVFGGMDAEVGEGTTGIFLESAHFDARRIRRTSTRHLLRTDAAQVFEKGSDPEMVQRALDRAVFLLKKYANARIVSNRFDLYPTPVKPQQVHLKTSHVDRLLGIEMDRNALGEVLEALDMKTVEESGESIVVEVPTAKADVTREADVIEEILRIYGYDRVPATGRIQHPPVYTEHPSAHELRNTLADELKARGFCEMMGLSLAREEQVGEDRDDLVEVLNTSNRALNVMRPDLIGSGLEAIEHNQNRQQSDLRLYEYGRGYTKTNDEQYEEINYLNIWLCGRKEEDHWKASEDGTFDFYSLKSHVHAVLNRCGVYGFQVDEIEEDGMWSYGLHYYRGPHPVATFGRISDQLCDRYQVDGPIFGAQIHWKALFESASAQRTAYTPLSRYPTVERDLALVLDEGVDYARLERSIRKSGGNWLKKIRLFDSYRNEEQLGSGKKSYAVRMVFENPEKTLSDEEVNQRVDQIIEQLEHELGAELR